jgi:hypothetical protein
MDGLALALTSAVHQSTLSRVLAATAAGFQSTTATMPSQHAAARCAPCSGAPREAALSSPINLPSQPNYPLYFLSTSVVSAGHRRQATSNGHAPLAACMLCVCKLGGGPCLCRCALLCMLCVFKVRSRLCRCVCAVALLHAKFFKLMRVSEEKQASTASTRERVVRVGWHFS